MMELFQAEWCPASHRIRERLTELDVAYLIRQVPVARAERAALAAATGQHVIPALVPERGTVVVGEKDIRAWLDEHVVEPSGAGWHRKQAELVRRRERDDPAPRRTSLHSLEPHTPEVFR